VKLRPALLDRLGGVRLGERHESTALARTLTPVFDTLVRWSEAHLDEVIAARRLYSEDQHAATSPGTISRAG